MLFNRFVASVWPCLPRTSHLTGRPVSHSPAQSALVLLGLHFLLRFRCGRLSMNLGCPISRVSHRPYKTYRIEWLSSSFWCRRPPRPPRLDFMRARRCTFLDHSGCMSVRHAAAVWHQGGPGLFVRPALGQPHFHFGQVCIPSC